MSESTKGEEPEEPRLAGLVVIGSSAGGIDAVLTLLGDIPTDFPAPIVIAQHLDPRRPSRLGELLSKRTSLRVRTATDREPLEAGTVYVVPADRDVEITDQHLGLREDSSGPSHPSVNRLMSTAAEAFGERLIGVVLTGTGVDGAAGALSIKEHGGTVIVQNPETAEFSGMPSAVPPSAIDVVAELNAIAHLLVELYKGNYVVSDPADSTGQDQLASFLHYVRGETGLDFSTYKRPTIERRLQRRMVAIGAQTLDDYRKRLDGNPEEMQRLVSSFLIKVTGFFRDPEFYAHLRDHVLPRLLDDAAESGELRLWSAGCATGEEAYTLAMLVADLLEAKNSSIPVRIFATDVARDAVDFARRGVYPASALEDMPEDMVERHTIRQDGTCEIRKAVRSLIIFGEHDLSRRAPFPRIDLVLCRNVLIYFTPELQRRSLQLFAFSLRSGGNLVLGKAESVRSLPEFFTAEHPRLKVYRRTGPMAPMPIGRIFDTSLQAAPVTRPGRRSGKERNDPQSPSFGVPANTISYPSLLVGMQKAGVVIVDRNYDIRWINKAARQLLSIHGEGLGDDIVHQVPAAIAEKIREALDAGLRGERAEGALEVPRDIVDERGRSLTFSCGPADRMDDERVIENVILEVIDVTDVVETERELRPSQAQARAESDELKERAAAAIQEGRELRAADQSMAAETARLRAENEQLLVATEEAQAAAEEIETLSEEQQATSEELETLNEELQATVEELNTTNADLQSRSIELEELADTLEFQRRQSEAESARLEAILANMGDAVLVVDSAGNATQTNAAWDQMLGPIQEFSPEDEHGQPLPPDRWPQQRASKGEAFTSQFSTSDHNGGRRWFEAHSQPVALENNAERWGVVVVRNITDRSLRRMQERFIAVASHELRTPMTSLSGSLQLLARKLPKDEREGQFSKYVLCAQEQMRRMESLIGELTDVARLQGGTFRLETSAVDVIDPLKEAIDVASQMSARQEVRIAVPDEPVMVDGDAYRLEQVFLNLIINASRHARTENGVDVRLRKDGFAAVVEVQDYGQGIPDDLLPNIFSQFYQTTNDDQTTRGLGLGLFIVQEIVTAHGGTIDVRSAVGKGTTFEIRLPLTEEQHES